MASNNNNNSLEFFDSQLVAFIRTMENDGLLDSNFANTRSLKEHNGPFYFAELISDFFHEMGVALAEWEYILGQPTIDFRSLLEICYKMKGSTACIGISRLKNAIVDLKDAAINRSKERCVSCLTVVNNEYDSVQEKLETVLQLERRTLTHQGA